MLRMLGDPSLIAYLFYEVGLAPDSSSERLSFSLKEPVEVDCLILAHQRYIPSLREGWRPYLSSKDDEISYSRTISHFRVPI